MKKRIPAIVCFCVGAAMLIVGGVSILLWFFYANMLGDSPSVTLWVLFAFNAVFGGWQGLLILMGTAIMISSGFCLLFFKTVQNVCGFPTGLTALVTAALLGLALAIAGQRGTILGMATLIVMPIIYVLLRRRNPSTKGVVIDIAFALLFVLPCFFFAMDAMHLFRPHLDI